MISKTILAISFVAVFAVVLISSPVLAEAIEDLVKTKVKVKNGEYRTIDFKTASKVPKDGSGVFGGYAVFTDGLWGEVIAVTSHDRFFDSEVQQPNSTEPLIPISLSAARCTDIDPGCGGEWHSHVVKPVSNDLCVLAAVGGLSFQEPSDRVIIAGKHIIVKGVDIGPQIYLESISSTGMFFNVGNPVDFDPSTDVFDGAAFDLNPTFDGDGNLVVCIGPLAP